MAVLGTLPDVVRSLGTAGSVTLERSTAGSTNSEGAFVPGSTSLRPMAPTVVHPISGADRSLLPEGVRTRETLGTPENVPMRPTLRGRRTSHRKRSPSRTTYNQLVLFCIDKRHCKSNRH